MKVICGNILDIKSGIIVHQVNCKGVMSDGLAKDLREKYPIIFPRYEEFCKSGLLRPGMVQFVKVDENLYVCNLAGQDSYGRDGRYTDYDALTTAFTKLHYIGLERSLPIYIPYKMGCGLAGGDWEIVSSLITDWCPWAIVVQLVEDVL